MEDADLYKCTAANDHGAAVFSVSLSVTESTCKYHRSVEKREKKPPTEEEMLKILSGADKKDYERICAEYGFTDFRGILRKLKEMKKKVDVDVGGKQMWLHSLKGNTLFDTILELKDPNIKMFWFQVNLQSDVTVFSCSFYLLSLFISPFFISPSVRAFPPPPPPPHPTPTPDEPLKFLTGPKPLRVTERQTAAFEVRLSKKASTPPVWMFKGKELKRDEKLDICVSEDGLTYTLKIKDVRPSDTGDYTISIGDLTTTAPLCIERKRLQMYSAIEQMDFVSASTQCSVGVSSCESLSVSPLQVTRLSGVQVVKQGAVHKLVFSSVAEEHEGRYSFRAKGAESEAALTLADPPVIEPTLLEALSSQPVTVKAGETATIRIPFRGKPAPRAAWHRDGLELVEDGRTVVEHRGGCSTLVLSRCVREDSGHITLRLKSDCGSASATVQLKVIDRPKAPQGKVEFPECSGKSISMKWKAPRDNGGRKVTGFIIERRLAGKKAWIKVGEVDGDTTAFCNDKVEEGKPYQYRIRAVNSQGTSDPLETEQVYPPGVLPQPQITDVTKDAVSLTWAPPAQTGGAPVLGYIVERRKKGSSMWVCVINGLVEDMEYEFRVTAVNRVGEGIPSSASSSVLAKDPTRAPGLVRNLCVTDSSNTSISLAWSPPELGDRPSGYILEVRPEDAKEWTKCTKIPIAGTSYSVGGLQERMKYFFRIRAVNEGGIGEPIQLEDGVLSMPTPGDVFNVKNQMVVHAGCTLCIPVSFTGSPAPEVTWLKDTIPTRGREVITKGKNHSQFLISSCQRSDSGPYRVNLRNDYGEVHYDINVHEVQGTVTLQWNHTPDLAGHEDTHYIILKRDMSTPTWFTASERIYSSKYTVIGLFPGRKYYFRIIARNLIGDSDPLDSKEPFTIEKEYCEIFFTDPAIVLPLKDHAVHRGNDCTMSCAFLGRPVPQAAWYKDGASLSGSPHCWQSSAGGVCTLTIPTCTAKDSGAYTLRVENNLGQAEAASYLPRRFPGTVKTTSFSLISL
uniref:Immunoglobulin superfamily member 22 n=1 Tax=Electrophorus electricus TaxID=8005 RepID=A0A4W4HKI3_ELEEL